MTIRWSIRSTPGQPYASARINGPKVYAHRLVMERVVGRPLLRLEWVDHINGNPSDCRRENLRLTDPSGNAQNLKKIKSPTGIRGVTFDKRNRSWCASVTSRGVRWFRRFRTVEQATMAAVAKRKELGFLGAGDA